MLRRALFSLIAAATALAAGRAAASGPPSGGRAAPDQNYVDIALTAVPIISERQLVNYVFVAVRLWTAPGADVAALRTKEPYFRDALVRAAHRAPFNTAQDLNHVDVARLTAVVLADATRIAGPRAFHRAQVMRQTAQRGLGAPPRA